MEIKSAINTSFYIREYETGKIDEKKIVIISKSGNKLSENLLRILKELSSSEYSQYTKHIVFSPEKKEKILKRLKDKDIHGVKLIRKDSLGYYRALCQSKYIFTDTSMPSFFIKKDGQIIIDIWKGTSIKKEGFNCDRFPKSAGGYFRTLLMSNYIVIPSIKVKEQISEAYGLDNLFNGRFLLSGYPRNSVFFEKAECHQIKNELALQGKDVYVYLPTWRNYLRGDEDLRQIEKIQTYLDEIEERLSDGKVLFVKLHPHFKGLIDYSKYRKIYEYPQQYNVYDFLSMSAGLITDYSNILFDYANSRKKIVLFPYDEEEYNKIRGLEIPLSQLPYPKVYSIENLVREIEKPITYSDDSFIKEYCTYEGACAGHCICQHVILDNKLCKEIPANSNGRENVLIYMGKFVKNGIVTAFLTMVNSIDINKRNYYMCFEEADFKANSEALCLLPEGVGAFPLPSQGLATRRERHAIESYKTGRRITAGIKKIVDGYFERERTKCFYDAGFSCAINYVGYTFYSIKLIQNISAKKAIYVHNDMVQEIKNKGYDIVSETGIRDAYSTYDRIVGVSEDLIDPITKLGGSREQIIIANHFFDYKHIKEKGKLRPSFDKNTVSNYSEEEIIEYLEDSRIKTIVTCGRFAKEKNHIALIIAFEKFVAEHPNYQLLIIGGYGALYNETVECANAVNARVIVIKSLDNPHAFISKCDFFILPSTNEGLPFVILEADALGLPVITTDTVGPRKFMKKNGGIMVEPTEEGLCESMELFEAGKAKKLNLDFLEFNKKAQDDFEKIFQ